ncbi:PIN/TRAM domain-containing protein [Chloroflexota bacterium]
MSSIVELPLSLIADPWDKIAPPIAALALSVILISVMAMRGGDFLRPHLFFSTKSVQKGRGGGEQIILDTSAIIDGRIADISQTGFISGTFVITRFILDELRHIADTPDALRRNWGRRGLDMFTKLQKESDVPVLVSDTDFEDINEVDVKLVKLARTLRCPIVSNDFNLNRVAEIQGVRVLNVNELANALKAVVLPGEDMTIRVIQEGKESGQGVGFLDDDHGTVVEGGRRYLGNELTIVITRVLQTAAGRMIFAHPRELGNGGGRR